MNRSEQIEHYLKVAKEAVSLEEHIDELNTRGRRVPDQVAEEFITVITTKNNLWMEYNLTRQEITDYKNKKTGTVKATSVQDALKIMQEKFG